MLCEREVLGGGPGGGGGSGMPGAHTTAGDSVPVFRLEEGPAAPIAPVDAALRAAGARPGSMLYASCSLGCDVGLRNC